MNFYIFNFATIWMNTFFNTLQNIIIIWRKKFLRKHFFGKKMWTNFFRHIFFRKKKSLNLLKRIQEKCIKIGAKFMKKIDIMELRASKTHGSLGGTVSWSTNLTSWVHGLRRGHWEPFFQSCQRWFITHTHWEIFLESY